jgi:type III secretory pathway component EscU
MAGEKTEQPTPKRLREAKKKGQAAKSKDLSSGLLFVVAVGVLMSAGAGMSEELQNFMAMSIQSAVSEPWNGALLERLRIEGFKTFTLVLAPLLGASFIAALFVSFIQGGAVFTMER